ncbi:22341_t:CDS:2 [Dentiscutata erythropus]|uniref:22341_t:CDS:1 n=1 Tax=Dentiscutata erythropus TaxID=1348616 RepID=A0A9N9FTQ7_9GLOM|nr:22341_t:CDS:2 [Dentiscutata erythropus]
MDNLVVTIKKLRIQIQKNEDYITYLEKEITTRDDEIDILRIQVNDLKIRLRRAEADAQSNDKNISALELQLQDMSSELFSLQHRIQKLRETMTLDMTHLPSTNTPVFNLITDVRTNIKLLGDSARGDNTLLKDEIDNFQTQAELKLTQIQNGCYTFENEVTQLRQEVINLKDINFNQQELTNELGTLNETLKEQIDVLSEKNETIQIELVEKVRLYEQAQDRLNECRDKCYQIRESLEGAHEDITEGEFAYDELKQKLPRTAWRNQRNRNQNITQELQNCREHVNRTMAQLQGDGHARITGHLTPSAPVDLNGRLVAADAGADQSGKITLSRNDLKKFITGLKGTIARGDRALKKPPGPGKQKADNLSMNRFLDQFIDGTSEPGEGYDYDPIDDLNIRKDLSAAKSKAEIVTKSKKIRSLESMIKILEGKLASAQKDAFSTQEDSLKKESEILSLKSKIAEVEQMKSELWEE